ncbi:MAG: hypothetical protein Q8P90_03385 [bacterium]|nr:hypothetical protein [bacterium]
MKAVNEITEGKKVYALIYSADMKADGVRFLTPQNYPLQVGLLEHPKGHKVKPHRHPSLKYNVSTTQEFLYIEKGSVEATIYRNDWTVLKKVKLNKGDFALFVAGGHSFKMLSKCRIIEIKQGPYPGDKKAKIFMD